MMKIYKWAYGILSAVSTITLIVSFFIPEAQPLTQIAFLIQAVGFGWVCGFAVSTDALEN